MSGFHFGKGHTPYAPEFRPSVGVRIPFPGIGPGWKLTLMLTVVTTTALMPLRFWAWHVSMAVFLACVVAFGRLPLRPLLLRLLWLAPFVAGTALAAAWQGPSGPGWQTVALRGGLCLCTVLIFAAATPFGALPGILRRVGVPAILVTTMTLMHRYLFVLVDESDRMRRARACRTFTPKRGLGWGMPAEVIARLFMRASERAERIYMAMCARGWK